MLGCQGADGFRAMLPAALNFGVTPVERKEIVYQVVVYLGIGRVYPFLKITNKVLAEKGVDLPLPPQATTTVENRREAGTQAQVDIFGKRCGTFGSPVRRKASILISGWQITALVTTIHAIGLTTGSVK